MSWQFVCGSCGLRFDLDDASSQDEAEEAIGPCDDCGAPDTYVESD